MFSDGKKIWQGRNTGRLEAGLLKHKKISFWKIVLALHPAVFAFRLILMTRKVNIR